MITYCDVNTCEDCPRYGDDCDGDKKVEHTDYISRANAIDAVCDAITEERSVMNCGLDMAIKIIKGLPPANAVPQTEHDREWIIGCIKHDGFIKTHRFDKANQIILDALSADAVQGEWDSNQACSICGCQPWYEHDIHTLHYCPNCGARMKGGAK